MVPDVKLYSSKGRRELFGRARSVARMTSGNKSSVDGGLPSPSFNKSQTSEQTVDGLSDLETARSGVSARGTSFSAMSASENGASASTSGASISIQVRKRQRVDAFQASSASHSVIRRKPASSNLRNSFATTLSSVSTSNVSGSCVAQPGCARNKRSAWARNRLTRAARASSDVVAVSCLPKLRTKASKDALHRVALAQRSAKGTSGGLLWRCRVLSAQPPLDLVQAAPPAVL